MCGTGCPASCAKKRADKIGRLVNPIAMPSVHEIKCPVCGAENGPCIVENGQNLYHTERKRAAYPTRYEHPDCAECRELKDASVDADSSYRAFRPDFGGNKPKSRWPKDWRSESHRLEFAAKLARAKYSFHLASVHSDEGHQR